MTGHPDQEFFLMKPRKTLARSNMPAGPENTGCKCGEIRRRPIHGPTAPHGLVSGRSRLLGLAIFAVGLLPLANVLPAVAGGGDGFDSLFNGNSLDGWRGKAQFWSVRDGSIDGETTAENPTDGNTFLIFRDRVADFELVLKVRILQGNSGIQYRSVDVGNSVVHGYQADMDAKENLWGDLYEEGGRGVIAKSGEKVEIGEDGHRVVVTDKSLRAPDVHSQDWNDYRVIAVGNRVVHEINGHRTVEVTDRQTGKARTEGLLALQLHAGAPMHVQFKDIYLKKLP